MTNDEIQDYDLSTTGVIVELTNTASHERYGVLVEATAAVDFEIEVDGVTCRRVCAETADAILGSGGRG